MAEDALGICECALKTVRDQEETFAKVAKRFKCSRWGVLGCFVGSIVGLFLLPLGIVLGPFLGTIAGVLIARKNLAASFRGGFGALFGFSLCLGLKLVAVGLYAWWYFAHGDLV